MSHTIHSLQEVFGTVVSAYQQNQSDEPEVEETSDEQITKQVIKTMCVVICCLQERCNKL